jgi:four helix bundle protein
MSTFETFVEIEAWQKARQLSKAMYEISSTAPFARDFSLKDQIRRASVSVMSNIAEGYERGGTKEFLQFLSMAKGSIGEVRSLLYVARDQGYIDERVFLDLSARGTEISRMISGLMAYLHRCGFKGVKFK